MQSFLKPGLNHWFEPYPQYFNIHMDYEEENVDSSKKKKIMIIIHLISIKISSKTKSIRSTLDLVMDQYFSVSNRLRETYMHAKFKQNKLQLSSCSKDWDLSVTQRKRKCENGEYQKKQRLFVSFAAFSL